MAGKQEKHIYTAGANAPAVAFKISGEWNRQLNPSVVFLVGGHCVFFHALPDEIACYRSHNGADSQGYHTIAGSKVGDKESEYTKEDGPKGAAVGAFFGRGRRVLRVVVLTWSSAA